MKEKLFNATIIVTVLPAVCYAIAFIFISIYQGYYDLPSGMFLTLNINTVTPIVVVVFTYIIIILTVIVALSVLISFVLWLLNRIPSRLINKFAQKISESYKNDYKKLLQLDLKSFIVYLAFFLFGSIFFSEYWVNSVKDYLVIHQKDGYYAELFSYNDSMVIAPINLRTDTMTPKFTVIDIKDLKNDEMVHFKNGLKVAKERDSQDLIKQDKPGS